MSGPRPRVAAVVGLGAALLLLGVAVAVGSDWFSGDSGRQVSWTTDKVMLNQSMAALRTLRHQLEAAEPLGRHPDLAEEIGCRPGEGGAGVEQPEGAALWRYRNRGEADEGLRDLARRMTASGWVLHDANLHPKPGESGEVDVRRKLRGVVVRAYAWTAGGDNELQVTSSVLDAQPCTAK